MILLKIFILQVILAAAVLAVLWFFLERELLGLALEHLEHVPSQDALDQEEVVVLTARGLPRSLRDHLRRALQGKFPRAEISWVSDPGIGAGVVIRSGGTLIDASLLGRIQSMWGRAQK